LQLLQRILDIDKEIRIQERELGSLRKGCNEVLPDCIAALQSCIAQAGAEAEDYLEEVEDMRAEMEDIENDLAYNMLRLQETETFLETLRAEQREAVDELYTRLTENPLFEDGVDVLPREFWRALGQNIAYRETTEGLRRTLCRRARSLEESALVVEQLSRQLAQEWDRDSVDLDRVSLLGIQLFTQMGSLSLLQELTATAMAGYTKAKDDDINDFVKLCRVAGHTLGLKVPPEDVESEAEEGEELAEPDRQTSYEPEEESDLPESDTDGYSPNGPQAGSSELQWQRDIEHRRRLRDL
jgi:hypothetical protein